MVEKIVLLLKAKHLKPTGSSENHYHKAETKIVLQTVAQEKLFRAT